MNTFRPLAKGATGRRVTVPHSYRRVEVGPPPKRNRKRWPFQGTVEFQGLTIDVENVRGSYREGTDPDGHPWRTLMRAHYGEIRGTEGADADKLDVYLGRNADSPLVVVVHQQDPQTKRFDEDKVMLGFDSEADAVALYRQQYDRRGYYGGHTAMPIGQFWRWSRDERNRGRKVHARKSLQNAPGAPEPGWAPIGWGDTFSDVLGVAWALLKAKQHKYLRRVPYIDGKGRRRYRYYYRYKRERHGRHHSVEHEVVDRKQLVVGAKIRDKGEGHTGHWEVIKADKEEGFTIRHDETGEEKTFSDVWGLSSYLGEEHKEITRGLRREAGLVALKHRAEAVEVLRERTEAFRRRRNRTTWARYAKQLLLVRELTDLAVSANVHDAASPTVIAEILGASTEEPATSKEKRREITKLQKRVVQGGYLDHDKTRPLSIADPDVAQDCARLEYLLDLGIDWDEERWVNLSLEDLDKLSSDSARAATNLIRSHTGKYDEGMAPHLRIYTGWGGGQTLQQIRKTRALAAATKRLGGVDLTGLDWGLPDAVLSAQASGYNSALGKAWSQLGYGVQSEKASTAAPTGPVLLGSVAQLQSAMERDRSPTTIVGKAVADQEEFGSAKLSVVAAGAEDDPQAQAARFIQEWLTTADGVAAMMRLEPHEVRVTSKGGSSRIGEALWDRLALEDTKQAASSYRARHRKRWSRTARALARTQERVENHLVGAIETAMRDRLIDDDLQEPGGGVTYRSSGSTRRPGYYSAVQRTAMDLVAANEPAAHRELMEIEKIPWSERTEEQKKRDMELKREHLYPQVNVVQAQIAGDVLAALMPKLGVRTKSPDAAARRAWKRQRHLSDAEIEAARHHKADGQVATSYDRHADLSHLSALLGHMDPKTVPPFAIVTYDGNERAHCGWSNVIECFRGGHGSTMWHEFGHAIENASPGIKAASNALRDERGKGEEIRPLNEIHDSTSYESHEKAIEDQWDNAYSGKWYGEGASTEVLSMGVQRLFDDPRGFFYNDPQHFYFTLTALSGGFGKGADGDEVAQKMNAMIAKRVSEKAEAEKAQKGAA